MTTQAQKRGHEREADVPQFFRLNIEVGDLERAVSFYSTLLGIDGRKQARAFFDFLKREAPGFSDAYIVDIPPQLGIRETRRIIGLATLTADDVTTCADFTDTVGVNGWPLEMHVAGDVVWRWPDIPGSRGYNQLPYRMLVPTALDGRAFDNLMVAGRCASMTHEGQSAARVSGACFVMGEAAGTAAHLSLAGNTACADIAVPKLQQTLERGGVLLSECQGKIFGGGDMFPHQVRSSGIHVGRRNGETARDLLYSYGVSLLSESLFGIGHRQIIFDIGSGDVWARQVQPVNFPQKKAMP